MTATIPPPLPPDVDSHELATALAGELCRLAEAHQAHARELFASGGYWRAEPGAVEHDAVARALAADAAAIECRTNDGRRPYAKDEGAPIRPVDGTREGQSR
jgi:hypothetical protein